MSTLNRSQTPCSIGHARAFCSHVLKGEKQARAIKPFRECSIFGHLLPRFPYSVWGARSVCLPHMIHSVPPASQLLNSRRFKHSTLRDLGTVSNQTLELKDFLTKAPFRRFAWKHLLNSDMCTLQLSFHFPLACPFDCPFFP